jgi:hypothetical protein
MQKLGISTHHTISSSYNPKGLNPLQNSLGTNDITRTNLSLDPPRSRRPNSNRERLECTLRAVVIIVTICATNMQRDVRRLCKALQTVGDHLGAQITNLLALEAEVDHSPGTAGEINDGPGEGFVEGSVAAAEAGERLAGAEGFGEGRAEGEESIFRGVVVVNWERMFSK